MGRFYDMFREHPEVVDLFCNKTVEDVIIQYHRKLEESDLTEEEKALGRKKFCLLLLALDNMCIFLCGTDPNLRGDPTLINEKTTRVRHDPINPYKAKQIYNDLVQAQQQGPSVFAAAVKRHQIQHEQDRRREYEEHSGNHVFSNLFHS